MTWTKLSGGFADRPALLSVSRGVRFLHVEALLWSNTHSQDGNIPKYVLGRITDEPEPDKAAALLVDAGIWEETADGWLIVDSLNDQPSAADTERTLKLWRDRQRRQRQHRSGDHSLCDPRYCHVTRDSRVSHDTRTEPYRTEPQERGEVRKGAEDERSRLEGARSAPAEGKASAAKRCGLCDAILTVDDAGWFDPNNGAHLCDRCYEKTTCPEHHLDLPCRSCAADRKVAGNDKPEPIQAIHRMASILGVEPTPCEDDNADDEEIYVKRAGLDFGAYTNTNIPANHITVWAERVENDDTWPEDKPLPDEPFRANAIKVDDLGTRDYRPHDAVDIAQAWQEQTDRAVSLSPPAPTRREAVT